MRIGVPREIKNSEFRVAMTPAGARELTARGHQVLIETDAGRYASFHDDDYRAAGATIVDAAHAWDDAELVVKVKEPLPEEYGHLREGLTVFTYLHLAADRPLVDALLASGATTIAYETVQLESGMLPLLYPMSEVAGCLAPQLGAQALMRTNGGRGVLMGGIGGVANAKVVILGAGVAGQNAAAVAMGMGADVTLLDTNLDKLRAAQRRWENRVRQLASTALTVEQEVLTADLVIGTVLIPGAAAPKLISRAQLKELKPGAVLVDVAIDQGGCFETSRPTTHQEPTYEVDGIIHYCVANMPGGVARTSTFALTNATLPFAVQLANKGAKQALLDDEHLLNGLNVHAGKITYKAVADDLGYAYVPAREALA